MIRNRWMFVQFSLAVLVASGCDFSIGNAGGGGWLLTEDEYEAAFGALARGDVGKVIDEFGVAVDALVAEPLEKAMQHVDGRPRVIERTVGRLRGGAEQLGHRGESHRGCLVLAEHAPRELYRAQRLEARPRDAQLVRSGLEERHVETGVVRDEHAAAREFEERR